MRAVMNFAKANGWWIQILVPYSYSSVVCARKASSREELLRIIGELGGDVGQAATDMQRFQRGCVWIQLTPAECESLGIRKRETAQ
jgi:hypothetical protein